jgi:hypothetical protein
MFRVGLIALTALGWGVALLVAGHRSSQTPVLGRWSHEWVPYVVAATSLALLSTLTHLPSVYSRLHRLRHRLALLVVTVAFDLVLVECGLRLFDPFGLSYFDRSLAYDRDKVLDPELIFWNPSNFHANYGEIRVSTNELGMRDDPVRPKQPGEFRVAAIGDSVTFGWGVQREETWCYQLQQKLAAERASRGPARVLDTGCGGYDSQQELHLLRRLGEKLEPDVVLLLYVPNDVETNVPPFQPMRQFELTGKGIPQIGLALLRRTWLGRFGFFVERQQTMTVSPPTPREPGWQLSMESVAAMKAWCDAHHKPFVLFFWRARSDLNTDALWTDLVALGAANHFPVVDVLPWLKDVPKSELCLSAVDAHPTPRTHVRLAEGMFQSLHELGLVPN